MTRVANNMYIWYWESVRSPTDIYTTRDGEPSRLPGAHGMGLYRSKKSIVATDGSVIFGMGYHSWLIVMENEDILLAGGGGHSIL
jgi:hypothetical protein